MTECVLGYGVAGYVIYGVYDIIFVEFRRKKKKWRACVCEIWCAWTVELQAIKNQKQKCGIFFIFFFFIYFLTGPLTEVRAVEGGRVLLPCDLDPPTPGDTTLLVLFFRFDSVFPIYRYEGAYMYEYIYTRIELLSSFTFTLL